MSYIGISKKPDDPKEAKDWIETMKRMQISMWVDGISCCAECGIVYQSVDDFIRRNPKHGGMDKKKNIIFVDDVCWKEYSKKSKTVEVE